MIYTPKLTKDEALSAVRKECDPGRLEDGLRVLLDTQIVVSGLVPGAFDDEAFPAYTLALIEEIHEVARSLRWKPWTNRHGPPDKDDVLEELGDVLAFLGLFLHHAANRLGMSPQQLAYELATEYRATSVDNVKNHAREHVPGEASDE